MNKKYFFSVFILCCILDFSCLWAQPAASYQFTASNRTYVELSSDTLIGSKLQNENFAEKCIVADSGISVSANQNQVLRTVGFPIGFDFPFVSQNLNVFTVNTNGVIFLGKDSLEVSFTNYIYNNSLCPYLGNIITNAFLSTVKACKKTAISYKTQGEVGARHLCIQFKNILVKTNNGGVEVWDTINYQIILYEGSGKIEIAYKKCQSTGNNKYVGFQVGLRGNRLSDFHLRATNATHDWDHSLLAATGALYNTFSTTCYPAENLLYVFEQPPVCTRPETPISKGENIQRETYKIKGKIALNSKQDAYLILLSTSPQLTKKPEDGVFYVTGDSCGNGEIYLTKEKDGSFELNKLEASTTYYSHIYAFNYRCKNGPLYSELALIDTLKTLFSAPQASVLQVDTNFIRLGIWPNVENSSVLIIDNSKDTNLFCTPIGALQVGDELGNGAKVIYKGKADAYSLKDLLPNQAHYLYIWSIDTSSEGQVLYSTDYTTLLEKTAALSPVYYSFEKERQYYNEYRLPAGWHSELGSILSTKISGFKVKKDMYGNAIPFYLESMGNASDPNNIRREENELITPGVFLKKGNYRLRFEMCLVATLASIMPGNPPSGINFAPGDSLIVSDQQGKTLLVIDAQNYDINNDFVKIDVPFSIKESQIKKFNFRFTTATLSTLRIGSVRIEEKPSCDYPIEVKIKDSSLKTTEVELLWQDKNEREGTGWNISWKEEGVEPWSDSVFCSENPTKVENLNPQTKYRVRVQAVCGAEKLSQWSQASSVFTTYYAVPFIQTFLLPNKKDLTYWSFNKGVLPEVGNLTLYTNVNSYSAWDLSSKSNDRNHKQMAVGFSSTGTNDWLFTPSFEMPNTKTALSFTLSLNRSSDIQRVDSVNAQAKFLVVLSLDGGQTYAMKDTLLAFGKNLGHKLGNIDSINYRILLPQRKGKVQIGFYAENKGKYSNVKMFLDSVSVEYTCPIKVKLNAAVAGVDTALLSWNSEKEQSYQLRYKASSEEKYTYMLIQNKEVVLKDLRENTLYDWGLRSICELGDTSLWTLATFSTKSWYSCDTVQNARAETSYTTVILRWQAPMAVRFDIRYKKVGEVEWKKQVSFLDSVLLHSLQEGSKYEYSIRAQCSQDIGDSSPWIQPKTFYTLYMTCKEPDSVRVESISSTTALVLWNSDKLKFVLQYKEKEGTTWMVDTILGSKQNFLLSNLKKGTSYSLRLRSYCDRDNYSPFTETLDFKTKVEDTLCSKPRALVASAVKNEEALLHWNGSSSCISYELQFKEEGKKYLSKENVSSPYLLAYLTKNTSYLWKIKAYCGNENYSDWSEESSFITKNETHTELELKAMLNVFPENGLLKIKNNSLVEVLKLEILSVDGKLLKSYWPNLRGDFEVYLSLNEQIIIVRLYTPYQNIVYKIYFK
ncbi:MAG: fibronectin type III domain-containing protein [Bacteroidales bacterium]